MPTFSFEPAGEESPEDHPPARQPNIMVIDDSHFVRTVVQATFDRIGIPVTAFASGMDAIGAMSRCEVPVPDLLLLDIGLERHMDGFSIAKILRDHQDFRHTRIVMLTGHTGVFDHVRSKLVGADGYIEKPFHTAYLVERVRELLGEGGPRREGGDVEDDAAEPKR